MLSDTVLARISALLKAKRREGGIGLRAAAHECGVSPSTLSRLERGVSPSLPDIETLAKLASWLNVSVDSLLFDDSDDREGEIPSLTTPEVVEVHLRADKNLSSGTAQALSEMFQLLYSQFSNTAENETGQNIDIST